MTKRIFDCFCYLNEKELLELRLQTLWNHVDIFVIVESDFTQSGLFKGQNLLPSILEPYKAKVRYIHLVECPGGQTDLWLNENHQRNQIARGLTDLHDQDWVIVSDLDEIPNPESIAKFDPQKFVRGDFVQQMFGYKLNNKLTKPQAERSWYGSKITTGWYFRQFFQNNATSVRHWKSSGLLRSIKRWWFKYKHVQRLQSGGWHFSWAIPEDHWPIKFSAFAHQEFAEVGKRSLDEMRELVESGHDLIFPQRGYERLPHSDSSLPIPVQITPERFQSIMLADPK
jgi:beta-1,4-mannosyl-glycoprotein beta-1,4-N-acetylglucosaminyltransferase